MKICFPGHVQLFQTFENGTRHKRIKPNVFLLFLLANNFIYLDVNFLYLFLIISIIFVLSNFVNFYDGADLIEESLKKEISYFFESNDSQYSFFDGELKTWNKIS